MFLICNPSYEFILLFKVSVLMLYLGLNVVLGMKHLFQASCY